MLFDLLEFVRNPFPWYLAPMGYVRELNGIAGRARVLAPEWRSHLENSRRIIRESSQKCRAHKSVLVVGSGNLLDVPLDTLCARFERVVLLDILHSRATKTVVRGRHNVELVAADVTGIAQPVFRAARRRDIEALPRSKPPNLGGRRFDLVISVNLLSQLAVIPRNFLKGHCPSILPARLDALSRDLVESHLRWISGRAEQVCLITDVIRVETPINGPEIHKDIVEGVDLPSPDEAWDWQIAPLGKVYQDRSVVHRVHAYRDYSPV